MSRVRVAGRLCLAAALLPWLARAQAFDPQVQALQSLATASAIPLEGSAEGGSVRVIRTDVAATGATTGQQAAQFLQSYAGAFGQSSPDQGLVLRAIRPEGPTGSFQIASFAQTYRGLPVFGASISVAVQTSAFTGQPRIALAAGALMPDPGLEGTLASTPSLGPDTCIAAGRAFLAQPTAEALAAPKLMVYDGRLFGETPGARLVWSVALNPQPLPPDRGPSQVLCDAQTGEVVFSQPFYQADLDLWLGLEFPNPFHHYLGDENGLTSEGLAHTDAKAEWTYAHLVYNFFNSNFGWRGTDGNDSELQILVDAATNASAQFYWDPFGEHISVDPGESSYDTTAHEFSHGIMHHTSTLTYSKVSGALNEGYADAMGVFVDFWDWKLGEDRPGFGGKALRDFSQPGMTCYGSPINTCTPERFSQLVNLPGSIDNGGVHVNSGILNKAHYLMATGDAYNGRPAFGGIGRYKMGVLAFTAMRVVPSGATFQDARAYAVFLAQLFAQQSAYGFTSADVCAVKDAFDAVEIGNGDWNCDGIDEGCVDPDGDFRCNGADNCPNVKNPNQADFDMDGVGDACDDDMDNDGKPDSIDNCPTIPNWDQKNTDGDGQGDACDDDDDNDGFVDSYDNCPQNYNPDQKDGDMDGIPDACGDPDLDGDGWYENDNCTFVYNDLQFDTDMDGLGDACDRCPNTYDPLLAYAVYPPPPHPLQPDSDDDGIPDACDGQAFGLASLELNGQPYNPTQMFAPGGAGADGTIAGPAGSKFRIPVPLCDAASGPNATQIPEIVFTGLDPSVTVALLDDDGLGMGVLRPGPAGSTARGVRAQPDCSRGYFLEFSTSAAFPGSASFFAQTSFAPVSSANPWVTPGSGDPPPPPLPDLDADGLLDSADPCPTLFEPSAFDTDGDGVGDVCDTCSAAPNPRFTGSLANRTLVSGQLDDDADGRGNVCDFDHDQVGPVITASDFNLMKAAVGRLVSQSCGTPAVPCGKYDHDGTGPVITASDFNPMKAAVGKLVSSFPKCAACSPPWSQVPGTPGAVPIVGRPVCAGPACTYLVP